MSPLMMANLDLSKHEPPRLCPRLEPDRVITLTPSMVFVILLTIDGPDPG